MKKAGKILSGICSLAVVLSAAAVGATSIFKAKAAPMDDLFGAPEGAGGKYVTADDGSITVQMNGEVDAATDTWAQYTICKTPIADAANGYSLDLTFTGSLMENASIGLALGLKDTTTPLVYANSIKPEATPGMFVRFSRKPGEEAQHVVIKDGTNDDGQPTSSSNWIYANSTLSYTKDNYDADAVHTLSVYVGKANAEGKQTVSFYMDGRKMGADYTTFKAAGSYFGIIGQALHGAGDADSSVPTIKNIRLNGKAIAGTETVTPPAEKELIKMEDVLVAPTSTDPDTYPGGLWAQNPDGSIVIGHDPDHPWNEYRLVKNPVEEVDGGYTVELVYKGDLDEDSGIGLAFGLKSANEELYIGRGKVSYGYIVHLSRKGDKLNLVTYKKDKSNTEPLEAGWYKVSSKDIPHANYDRLADHSIKVVVKPTDTAGKKIVEFYFDGQKLEFIDPGLTDPRSSIDFEPSGNFMGIVGQKAFEMMPTDTVIGEDRVTETVPVDIRSVRVNGEAILGYDAFVQTEEPSTPESQPESKPESQPESKPESQPESKPESQPESKPESQPEKDTPFTDNFVAPEGGDDITTPGGDWQENADGSITIVHGENPWHEYRLYKTPLTAKDGSYVIELTYKGGFPGYGSIGLAIGLPNATTPFGFGEVPESGKNTKGLAYRFIRVDNDFKLIPIGVDADGTVFAGETETIMPWADYDATKEYTLKVIVAETADPAVKSATAYFDGKQIGEAINFKSAGDYMGVIAQQAYKDGDPNSPVVIKNIKVNGSVIAGVDYTGETSTPGGNSGSSTTTPPTGYSFPVAAMVVLGVSVLGFGVAMTMRSGKKSK